MNTEIPSFLLRREDTDPGSEGGRQRGWPRADGPAYRGAGCLHYAWIHQVEAVDTTDPVSGVTVTRWLEDRLDEIEVGAVVFRHAKGRALQSGRMHSGGIHWEEKTWPDEDFISFRDHLANLLESTDAG